MKRYLIEHHIKPTTAIRLFVLGYLILALGTAIGLYFATNNYVTIKHEAQRNRALILATRQLAMRNTTALTALCIERKHLDEDISTTKGILRRHHGRKVFGIPRGLFLSSLQKDETRRGELNILDC